VRLDRIYEYRFRDVDAGAKQAVWDEIAAYLYRRTGAPQRVLDPAAGQGEFITSVPAAERWAVDQVDHGLRDRVGDRARVVIAPVLQADLPTGYFDLVFASNLLEHLSSADAVAELLEHLRGLLVPGGYLVVMGPNFRHTARTYFDCADHVLALTHVSVAEHLHGAGLDVEDVVSRFLPYSFRSVLPASRRLTRAYLGFPPAWRLLGKQFLVTARRPVDG
jgi:SAM-dependent methyltransferase